MPEPDGLEADPLKKFFVDGPLAGPGRNEVRKDEDISQAHAVVGGIDEPGVFVRGGDHVDTDTQGDQEVMETLPLLDRL
jgi:hypothetical protein